MTTLLLVAASVVVVVFGVYQVLEATVLKGASPAVISAGHLARGVIAALATPLLVARRVVQRTPPLLRMQPATDDHDVLRQSARWYVHMRWLAVATALGLVALAVPVLGVLPPVVFPPLLVAVAVLAVSNLVYGAVLDRVRSFRRFLLGQILWDLAIFAVLLHFSGGLDNPVFVLPLLHVALAAIMLKPRDCYLVAGTTALLVAAVALSEWSGLLAHYAPHISIGASGVRNLELGEVLARLAVVTGVNFLVAYLVTTLAERSREHERRFMVMADRALAERQLLERALETTGTGLRVVDAECKPQWSNRRWDEWFPGDSTNGRAATVHQTVNDGKVRVSELCVRGDCDYVGLQPNDRTIQLTTAPITDHQGHVVQVVELLQEITQQKHAQTQMVRAGRMAAVGELAGQVAHEVNNPIAIISAKARLMLSGHRSEMSPKVATDISKIIALADRVAGIAQGLLSYCRPSPKTREPMDLTVPIRDAIAMIAQRARAANITIADELGEELGPVQANAGEMGQVFLNLLLNAVDAMPHGGTLTVRGLRDLSPLPDGRPCVGAAVIDTGEGVPEKIRERVWEPFFSTKAEGRGTGLGLSICMGLVTDHGGSIELESEPGEGACFSVRLPLAQPNRETSS